MCNVLLPDPNKNLWQLSVQDDGTIATTLTALNIPVNAPVLQGTNFQWALSAGTDGSLVASPAAVPSALSYIPLISPAGNVFKLVIDSGNLATVASSVLGAPEFIPRPQDVTMSQWPVSIGVTCPKCANAAITVGGDLSCWCCVCSSFVDANDTTILVVLEE